MNEKFRNEIMQYPELKEILINREFCKLADFKHHKKISRLDHTLNVANITYVYTKKHDLDFISATKGALLHDFFFYKLHEEKQNKPRFHPYRHPAIAYTNANRIFEINDIVKDIITRHMWPLTLKRPKYTESLIVSRADKEVAIVELTTDRRGLKTINKRLNIRKRKKYQHHK